MRRVLILAGLFIAFGAGWVAALLVPQALSPRVSADWYELSPPPGKADISYTTAALFKSDIALPDVEDITGSAKFVDDGASGRSTVRFGYTVAVKVTQLDLSKVPAKYKKEKLIDIGGGRKITQLPIHQVTYEVRFDFTLKDKDGFPLLELSTEPHNAVSGKTNTFQGFAPDAVSVGVASRTAKVILGMSVQKCLTCDNE